MKNIAYLLLFVCLSCKMSDSKINVNGITIPEDILMEINETLDMNYEEFNDVKWYYLDSSTGAKANAVGGGVCYRFVEESKAKEIFNKYYDKVLESGNYIFLTKLDFDENNNSHYTLVITKADDVYSVVKLMDTSGPNHNIDNNTVIKNLKKWDKEARFKFVVIDDDRVEAYMGQLPEDLDTFTIEVHKICPDVIAQGYGSIEDMRKGYKKEKYFWMWWD